MLILKGPDAPVEALTFSLDATTLYVSQVGIGIRAWNIIDRSATRVEFGGRLLIRQIVFHPGGEWAFGITAHTIPPDYDSAHLIHLPTGTMQPFNFVVHGNSTIATFPGSSRVITLGSSPPDPTFDRNARLCGWTLTPFGADYAWHREIALYHAILCITGLGEQFATADVTWADTPNNSITRVTIRNGDSGASEVELPFPHERIDQLLASRNGNHLVARTGTELHAWDASDWNRPPTVLAGKHNYLMLPPAAAFHPSGQYLLLANNTSSVIAFDTTTWKVAREWNWKSGVLVAVAVSPDGTLAAAAGPRGTAIVWDWDL